MVKELGFEAESTHIGCTFPKCVTDVEYFFSSQMRLSVAAVFLAAVASASAVSFFSVVLEEWEAFKVS